MKILLMRHGEAEASAPSDRERALTERGKANNRSVLAVLGEKNLVPDIILASPYLRAQQTAGIAAEVIKQQSGNIVEIESCPHITPEDDPVAAIRYFGGRSEQLLMVVTHNPFVTGVINMLCANGSMVRMGTSSMAFVESDILDIGCGELLWERHG